MTKSATSEASRMIKRFEPWFWVLAAVLFSRVIGMTLFPFVDTTEPRYAEIEIGRASCRERV